MKNPRITALLAGLLLSIGIGAYFFYSAHSEAPSADTVPVVAKVANSAQPAQPAKATVQAATTRKDATASFERGSAGASADQAAARPEAVSAPVHPVGTPSPVTDDARYSDARIISVSESPRATDGTLRRVTLLTPADSHYPVRIEEILDDDNAVLQKSEMVADRFIVKPENGREAELLAEVASLGGTARLISRAVGIYRVGLPYIEPDGVPEAIVALSESSTPTEYSEPDYIVYPLLSPNDPKYTDGSLWGMHNTGQDSGVADADIDAPEGWDIRTDASNVIVGVIDTGVRYTHEDIAANMWVNPGEDGLDALGNSKRTNGVDDDGNGWIDDVHGIDARNDDGDPMDDHGHGTHCAGTIAGVGNNGKGVTGVAWNAQIMALKFLGESGGSTSDAILCLDYAIDKGATLTSNSWGGGSSSQAVKDAIAAAGAAGQLFVVAAANDAADNDVTNVFPTNYELENMLSVAAMNRSDELASFSNYGSGYVDIGGPGRDIVSLDFNNDSGTISFSGTSMATPAVAGLAALVHAEFPGSDMMGVKNRILKGGRPVAALQGKTTSGNFMNLPGALQTTSDAPINDDFANAAEILEEPETVRANNRHATAESGEPSHAALGTNSIWFKYTATVNGTTIVNTTGSAFDTVIGVYTGSAVNALTLIGSNDDFGGNTTGRVDFEAVSGTTYYIAVAGKAGASGYVQLALSGPPEEDFLADAIDIPYFSFVYESDNTNASKEPDEPNHAGNTGGGSLWLKLRLADHGLPSQNILLNTRGSDFDALLAVYTSATPNPTMSDLVPLISNDDAPYGDTFAEVAFFANASTTYWIVSDGKDDARGTIRMAGFPQVANDDFDNAQSLAGDALTLPISARDAYYATREFGEPNHDNANGRGSLWYTWSPTTAGAYSIRTNSNTAIGVYAGSSIDALNSITPDLNNGTGTSHAILTNADPSTVYYIAVDNRGSIGFFGGLELSIESYFILANDDWQSAESITTVPTDQTPVVINSTNKNGTKQSGEPDTIGVGESPFTFIFNTVWYKWVAPESATYRVETDAYDVNTSLAVYAAPANPSGYGDFVFLAGGTDNGIHDDAVLRFDATAGDTYYIQVGGATNAEFGEFSLTLSKYFAPANDDLANAEEVTNFFVQREIDYYEASREVGEPTHQADNDYWNPHHEFYDGPSQANYTLWYKWTPADASQARRTAASSFGSGGSTIVAVYETTVANPGYGDLTPVKPPSSNWYYWWSWGEVWWNAELGKTYYIMLGHQYNDDFDLYRLSITQNPNDNFSEREVLPSEANLTRYTSNFAASTESGEPRIDNSEYGGRSLWYEWTAPTDGTYVFDTVRSSLKTRFFDIPDSNIQEGGRMQMAVYTGSSLGGLTKLKSSTDISMRDSDAMISINATAGTSYKIAVDSTVGPSSIVSGSSNAYTNRTVIQFNITSGSVDNDNLADAKVITGSYHQEFIDMKFASRESGEPSHGSYSNRSAWWKWTAPESGTFRAATSSDLFDTQDNRKPGIAVYSGPATGATMGSLSQLAQDNNNGGASTYNPAHVSFSVTAGQTYYIAIDDGGGSGGTIPHTGFKSGLLLAKTAGNNAFANATEITGSIRTVTGHNLGATWQSGEPQLDSWGTDSSQRSVWWKWTAPASGQTTVTTDGSFIYNELGVFTGSDVGSLTQIVKELTGGAFDNGFSYAERADMANRTVTFTASGGTTYYFMVVGSGYDNDSIGPITLTVSGQPGQPIAPTDLTATRITASRVDVAWTDNAVDETTYLIQRTAGLGGNWQEVFNSGEADTESWSDLSATSDFVYRIRAEGPGGQSDWVLITALPNDPPTASIDSPAGGSVLMPNASNRLFLSGSGTDDGATGYLAYSWARVSGPGTASFDDATASETWVSFDQSGNYLLRLTVDDGIESVSSEILVTVDAIPTGGTRYLINFSEPSGSYTTDGVRTWQTFDLNTGSGSGTGTESDPKAVNAASLLDEYGSASKGLTFSASGGTDGTVAWNLNATSGQLAADPFDWFNGSVQSQRDTFAVQNGSAAWDFSVAGFDSADQVRIEFVFARDNTGDRAMTVTYQSTGDVLDDAQVDTDGGPQYPVLGDLTPLTGATSYGVSIVPSGTGWGCLPNALAVTILESGSEAPAVDAGSDASVAAGLATNLSGNATDDGLPNPPAALTYGWTQISGPGTAVFGDATSPTSTVTLPSVGVYVLRLTVSDGDVSVADDVTLTAVGSPASLTAAETSVGEVTLTWPDATGETGYRVRMRRSGESDWITVSNSVASDAIEFIVNGLILGQGYDFSVDALDGATARVGASASLTTTAAASGYVQDAASPHLVVIEAENYSSKADNGSSDVWTATTSFAGYSGTAAMQVNPDDSDNYTSNIASTAPVLNFDINFNQTGTHYLLIRCREPGGATLNGSDSLHAGINGSLSTNAEYIEGTTAGYGIGTSWVWAYTLAGRVTRVSIEVPSTGIHTINIWPREDGVIVDKILLTTDVSYMPTGSETESTFDTGGPTLTALEAWRQTHFGTSIASGDTMVSVSMLDDGMSNLMKFALGGTPWSDASVLVPTHVTVADGLDDYLEFSYRRREGSGTGTTEGGYSIDGVTYSVMVTDSLAPANWQTGSVLLDERAADTNGDNTETVTVRVLEPIGDADQKFIRLEVTNP